MVELRQTLDTVESFNTAIEGLRHLPAETLEKFLLAHYTVDLDLMSDFLEGPQPMAPAAEIASPARRAA